MSYECTLPSCHRTRHSAHWCKPVEPCSVDGCGQPRRKRSWCSAHYTHWHKTGEEPKAFIYKWSDWTGCAVCGSAERMPTSRMFCSENCKQLHYRHGGNVPKTATCNVCAEEYDLFVTSAGGRKKRVDSLTCSNCTRLSHLGTYVKALRERDGDDCALCSEAIDFTLSYPDPGYRSVDHVVPWARGGKDELSNYQLSHMRCNRQRRDLAITEYKELMGYGV